MVDLGGKTLIYMIQKLCVISLLELILGMRILSLFPFLPPSVPPSPLIVLMVNTLMIDLNFGNNEILLFGNILALYPLPSTDLFETHSEFLL